MTRVKICGLRDVEAAGAAIESGADMLGFIFYPPARRYIEPALVASILDRLPRARVEAVGVFVNATGDEIAETARLCHLDLVQLSGDEPPEFIRTLAWPVARTVHVGPDTTIADARAIVDGARLIHLDAKRPGHYGGTGATFDWAFARAARSLGSVLLAGGLDPGNVASAIAAADPWGVDVSSGVETDGVKDLVKIEAFLKAVKT